MLYNKRKTIGVFAEKVKDEFQMRLCQGIIEEAELQGYNVTIFTNYGKYGQNNQHFIGDQMIWDLPCYEEFAGKEILSLSGGQHSRKSGGSSQLSCGKYDGDGRTYPAFY